MFIVRGKEGLAKSPFVDNAQYIEKTVRQYPLFSCGTFNSAPGWFGRNQMFGACCSTQTAHKEVHIKYFGKAYNKP